MRVRVVSGILALAALLVASNVSSQEAPPPAPAPVIRRVAPPPSEKIEIPPEGTTVPLTLRDNRPVVEVRINGEGPFPFVLDTGAMATVISDDLATRLALPAMGEVQVGSPAGGKPVPARMIRLDRLSVGDAVIHGAMAVAMDLSPVLRGPGAPAGVLSARIFEGSLLTLDYPAGAVNIRHGALPESDGATILQYEPSDPLPTIPISVAGVEVRAHLDTGSARGLMLPASYADRLPLASKPAEAAKARLVDGEMTVLGSTLKGDLRIGKFTFKDPEVQFGDRAPVANVGSAILGRFAVTLDSKNRRIRLEEPAGRPE